MKSLVGRKLGSYEILEVIGRGGMAVVYKGYRDDIDRTVAVKVLAVNAVTHDELVDRFQLEARTIARLQHPHILPLYDYGVENDLLYLVMAFAEGRSLGARIKQSGRLNVGEVEKILREVAGALDYAHRQGIVHRDLKPDNILMDAEGHSLLADFGIAKLMEGNERLTVTGGIVGTPAYIAPEQGYGEQVTPISDIYSLGVVVYEILTGKQPYSADTPMKVILHHINSPVPDILKDADDLPEELGAVMQRVLAKAPQDRYATATDFANDFARAVTGRQTQASTTNLSSPYLPPTPIMSPIFPQDETQASALNETALTGTALGATTFNLLALLGGFAIIAALVVVVVVLVLGNGGRSGGNDDIATATNEAVVMIGGSTNTPPSGNVNVDTPTPSPTSLPEFGNLSFGTTNSLGDTVQLNVKSLTAPDADQTYIAWLRDTIADEFLSLGVLVIDANGNGSLEDGFTDADGRLLLADYNSVIITQEDSANVERPTGNPLYGATLPESVMTAMSEIFIASRDGIAVGDAAQTDSTDSEHGSDPATPADPDLYRSLLRSAQAEAESGALHAGLAQSSTTAAAMHIHAEHTLNILQGTLIDHDGSGSPQNPGAGYGVFTFLDVMESQLSSVAQAGDADFALQSQVEFVRVCVVNVRDWSNEVLSLEAALLAADTIESVEFEASAALGLSEAAVNGVDQNQNERIEAFEGECGLAQIEGLGLQLGNMSLTQSSES